MFFTTAKLSAPQLPDKILRDILFSDEPNRDVYWPPWVKVWPQDSFASAPPPTHPPYDPGATRGPESF